MDREVRAVNLYFYGCRMLGAVSFACGPSDESRQRAREENDEFRRWRKVQMMLDIRSARAVEISVM
jgi:hypothetical protein